MRKSALSVALLVAASAVSAQGIPVTGGPLPMEGGIPVVDVEGQEADARSKAQAVLLVGIQQQLIELNQVLQRSVTGNAMAARVCKYEDKSYSEGAIRAVGAPRLICVERGDTRELVWEPIASRRHSAHLRATGQDPAWK